MKVSVLMSVFNENACHIKLAVDSILKQSFADLELIIVNDNPQNGEMKEILGEIKEKDRRIKVINNEKNMGLAMSMNVAAEHATADIFVRMDADDISDLSRIEKQYDKIKDGKYDLIATAYHYIDESGEKLSEKQGSMSDKLLYGLLPYSNTIHHPTVMMTKKVFYDAGGYRDFPCAQDYDLWLRMYDIKAKMHLIDEDLFAYRVRKMSTTGQKKVKQIATISYIRKLYYERKRKGKDSYSKENYNIFLDKNKLNKKYDKLNQIYKEGRDIKDKSILSKLAYNVKLLFVSPMLFKVNLNKVRYVVMKKKISS